MIYPIVDSQKWANMYKLKTEARTCLSCGKPLEKTVPFAFDKVRGLMSSPHGCPPEFDHSTSITLDRQENEILSSLMASFPST